MRHILDGYDEEGRQGERYAEERRHNEWHDRAETYLRMLLGSGGLNNAEDIVRALYDIFPMEGSEAHDYELDIWA